MNSVISETPGPDVVVKARAPFQPAPTTMPIDAISSSAWTIANLFLPLSLSTRSLLQYFWNASASEELGRDRIPGADRRAAVDAAERRRGVAFDEDALADRVAALDLQTEKVVEIFAAVMQAHHEGIEIGLQQLGLAPVLLAEQRRHHFGVDPEGGCQHAHVDDVLQQLALTRIAVAAGAQVGQRHAEDMDVVAEFRRRQGLASCRRAGSRPARSRPGPCPRSAGSSPPSGRRRRAAPGSRVSLTRTSYQVGRPWMFEGKMLRGLTGTPMRNRLRANSSFAEAEPEPLTLANLTTKSLTASRRGLGLAVGFELIAAPPPCPSRPACRCGNRRRRGSARA